MSLPWPPPILTEHPKLDMRETMNFMRPSPAPRVGSDVVYQTDGRGGHDYWLPAKVIITRENWVPGDGSVLRPSSAYSVSLMVFGPGGPYVEHDVGHLELTVSYAAYESSPNEQDRVRIRRTWRWPEEL